MSIDPWNHTIKQFSSETSGLYTVFGLLRSPVICNIVVEFELSEGCEYTKYIIGPIQAGLSTLEKKREYCKTRCHANVINIDYCTQPTREKPKLLMLHAFPKSVAFWRSVRVQYSDEETLLSVWPEAMSYHISSSQPGNTFSFSTFALRIPRWRQ